MSDYNLSKALVVLKELSVKLEVHKYFREQLLGLELRGPQRHEVYGFLGKLVKRYITEADDPYRTLVALENGGISQSLVDYVIHPYVSYLLVYNGYYTNYLELIATETSGLFKAYGFSYDDLALLIPTDKASEVLRNIKVLETLVLDFKY